METSTKNIIISGIFSLITGLIAGVTISNNMQNNIIEGTVQQSGVININKEDSSIDIVNKLLGEYITANDTLIILSDENDALNDEINALNDEINALNDEINALNDEIEMDSIDIEYPTALIDITNIKSEYYEVIERFVDCYDNTYPLAYHFDASNNAYAIYYLDQKFNELTGYITLSENTSKGAIMVVDICGDGGKVLKHIENISKSSMSKPIFIGKIDVSGINKLTINTFNVGAYPYGHLYFTITKLK